MKKISAFILTFILFTVCVSADDINNTYSDTAKRMYMITNNPTVSYLGGEWAVIGVARGSDDVSVEWLQTYFENAEKYIKECGGVLSDRKYTEYSRVIIALTAIGKNPRNAAGYDIVKPLFDFDKTVFQGINGAAWATIALRGGGYDDTGVSERYINYILERQNDDGGWSFSDGDRSDTDITAMILCALSFAAEEKNVSEAIQNAVSFLSDMQEPDGGYLSSESDSQVITALCSLKIPISDSRFLKNGKTVFDDLMTYYDGEGGFMHSHNESEPNQMATEQAFYTLAAVKRFNDGKTFLYDMSDVKKTDYKQGSNETDRINVPKMQGEKTFSDIIGNKYRKSIEELSSRGIINGKSVDIFDPDGSVTRAELSAIITRGLGLSGENNNTFSDVSESDWFYDAVSAAHKYEIVKGVSENEFNPNGTVTREEAAVMICRAARLCAINTDISDAKSILSEFDDYTSVSDWALDSMAFCFENKISDGDEMEIFPKNYESRAEIASMLYNILSLAKLL